MKINTFTKFNEKKAKNLIIIFSIIVFLAVVFLNRIKLNLNLPFSPNIFADINAIINTIVSLLLIAGFWAIKNNKITLHRKLMLTALILSILFLISYIIHKLLTQEVKFGDSNFDGIVSPAEKSEVGNVRTVYLLLLITHIFLASFILPFILFTAYLALSSNFPKHKKMAKITFPFWLYVSITGPLVYFMIKPYYH